MIWLLLLILLVCSGLISGSETALFALRRDTLAQFGRSPGWLRRATHTLMQQPRDVLLTVLMSNTTVNVAIFAVSTIALGQLSREAPALAAAGSVCTLLAVVLVGEMIPKAAALSMPQTLAPYAGAFIGVLRVALAPFRWVLGGLFVGPLTRLLSPHQGSAEAVSTDELHELVEHSASAGVFDTLESEMLRAVVVLREATVREVMTPRVDVRYLSIHDTPARAKRVFRETHRRFLPVCGHDLDDLRGVVRGRDVFLSKAGSIAKLVQPASYVPEQATLIHLLRHFREHSVHLAIVVDEYGGTAGLVSQRDVLSHIVGEMREVGDEQEAVPVQLDANTYRVPGNLSVREWADRFGVREIAPGIDTLGGLILSRLGRMPHEGDTVAIANLILRVDEIQNRRVVTVTIRRTEFGKEEGST